MAMGATSLRATIRINQLVDLSELCKPCLHFSELGNIDAKINLFSQILKTSAVIEQKVSRKNDLENLISKRDR